MMDDDTKQALATLLDYVERDEAKDYLQRPPEERDGHIYESIEIVRDWLGPVHCDQD